MFRALLNLFSSSQPLPIDVPQDELPTKAKARRQGPLKLGRPIHLRPIPDMPGLYRIILLTTLEIAYIGVAKNLRRRIAEHKRTGKYNPAEHRVRYQIANNFATAEDLDKREKKKTNKHRPSGNTRAGGAGPRWEQTKIQ